METNPLNTILHFWHYDPDFCRARGRPRPLQAHGDNGFEALVAKYAGDIPPGAIRASLIHAGSVTEDESGRLVPSASYYFPTKFSDDFIRGVAFAFGNLGSTLVHNAFLRQERSLNREEQVSQSRLERTIWSEHLRESDVPKFKSWVRDRAELFVDETNRWIGRHELPKELWTESPVRSVGVGVYYFEED